MLSWPCWPTPEYQPPIAWCVQQSPFFCCASQAFELSFRGLYLSALAALFSQSEYLDQAACRMSHDGSSSSSSSCSQCKVHQTTCAGCRVEAVGVEVHNKRTARWSACNKPPQGVPLWLTVIPNVRDTACEPMQAAIARPGISTMHKAHA